MIISGLRPPYFRLVHLFAEHFNFVTKKRCIIADNIISNDQNCNSTGFWGFCKLSLLFFPDSGESYVCKFNINYRVIYLEYIFDPFHPSYIFLI